MTDTTQREREDVPRVAVDTLHEWNRIRQSYANASIHHLEQVMAAQRMNDASKQVLRDRLHQLIDRTFDMAKLNVRVNGRNFEDLDEDEQGGLTPFDEALDRHIWSLSDQSLQWDGEIGRKRREKPKEVERLVRELVDARTTVDDEEREEFEQDVARREETLLKGVEEGVDDVNVGEDVQDVARRTFAIVDELQQSVQLQHARSDRLKMVTKEVKALKP